MTDEEFERVVKLEDHWDRCLEVAKERHELKKDLPWWRPWTKDENPYFMGCLGEVVYGKTVGQEPDFTLYPDRGDEGADFPGVDVKATLEENGYLVEFVSRVYPPLYVLSLLNMKMQYGFVKGWERGVDFGVKCTRGNFFERGLRKFMHKEDIQQGVPPEEVRKKAEDRWNYLQSFKEKKA